MASINSTCLTCGKKYHNCGSCGNPDYMDSYCCDECWSSSPRAIRLVALGEKIARLLEPYEVAMLRDAYESEREKVMEGAGAPIVRDPF